MLGDMRNRVPGFGEMFRSFAANSSHGDAFNLSPLREVRQLGLDEMSGARRLLRCASLRLQCGFGAGLHVLFADAAAGARALDEIDVDAECAGEAACAWSGWNRTSVLRSSDFVELCRHGKHCRFGCRLIGR